MLPLPENFDGIWVGNRVCICGKYLPKCSVNSLDAKIFIYVEDGNKFTNFSALAIRLENVSQILWY